MLSIAKIYRFGATALAIALVLTGCDSGNTPPIASGQYTGVFMYTVDGVPYEEDWVFNISERNDGVIEGTGVQGDDFVVVTGSHDHPDIILEFQAANDGYLGRLTGVMSDSGDRIEGTFTLTIIFNLVPVTLNRTG